MRLWRRTARNTGESSALGSLAATPRSTRQITGPGSPNLPFPRSPRLGFSLRHRQPFDCLGAAGAFVEQRVDVRSARCAAKLTSYPPCPGQRSRSASMVSTSRTRGDYLRTSTIALHLTHSCSFSSIWSSCNPVQIYRACMSRFAHDRADEAHDEAAEVQHSAARREDEIALVHERFAEEHEAAAESMSDDLGEAHRGAADKHRQAASEDRRQAQTTREEADTEHD